jgi:iron complex outermembrane receptor protein
MKNKLLMGAATVTVVGYACMAGAQDAATASEGGAVLEEITVTATKRSESLEKAPEAITAITGDALTAAGITDIRLAESLVPSVRFQQEDSSTEIYIRGVGSTLDYPQFEPPTAFNFNGIYVPREGTGFPLFDIDQIEVLPGPQGTLYGSNSMGGVVNVNFKRPTQSYETSGLFETGNYSLAHASVVQNVPITSTLAVRAAVDYLYHSGYMTSGADSADEYGVRLSALYKPNDAVSAYLWGYIADDIGGSPANLVAKGVNPVTGALEPNRYLNSNPWDDQYSGALLGVAETAGNGQPKGERWRGYSNKMLGGQFDFGVWSGATLTYIPSFTNVVSSPDYWLGAFEGNKTDHYDQTTHELRLSGQNGNFNWIGGLYGYHRTASSSFYFSGFDKYTGFPVTLIDYTRIQGAAAFGQLTYNISSVLRATAGGRFSYDDRVGNGRFTAASGDREPYTFDKSYTHGDYKLGLDYDLMPQSMVYLQYQTGYQPGTFNEFASTPGLSNEVKPATLRAISTGVKSRLLGDTLQINDEVFYYDYRGLFASAYDTVKNTNVTFNAQKVRIYGDQLDILYRVTKDDQFDFSIGYLHARNVTFDLPDSNINYDGFQLQYAPDLTVGAGYHHDFPMASGYIRGQVHTRFESAYYADFNHTPGGRQEPYTKTELSLTYYSNNNWSLGAWVRNIENTAVIAATAGGSNIPFNPQGATAFLEDPRTYGVRGTFKFSPL